jgi:hypothetical protein
MALRAAKPTEDTTQPLWGQGFGPAAELPLREELYVTAGNTGDLVAAFVKTASSTERSALIAKMS